VSAGLLLGSPHDATGHLGPPAVQAGEAAQLVYSGAFHLSLAAGRISCAAVDRPLPHEVRSLTIADLAWVRRGADALTTCAGGPNRQLSVQPDAFAPVSSAPEMLVALGRAREAYGAALRDSRCRRSALFDAIGRAADRLGSAAARTLCAISTWRGPLPPEVARSVGEDLAAAARDLQPLRNSLAASDGPGRLAALAALLATASGEEVYQHLEAASEAIRRALASPGPVGSR
jgi:hypothetical protein